MRECIGIYEHCDAGPLSVFLTDVLNPGHITMTSEAPGGYVHDIIHINADVYETMLEVLVCLEKGPVAPIYLGDSVYCTASKQHFMVWTDNGYGPTNQILLPIEAIREMCDCLVMTGKEEANDDAPEDGDALHRLVIDANRVSTFECQLVRLVGQCIQDQRNGFDVLASASWDAVVEHWTKAEHGRLDATPTERNRR